MRWNKIGIIIKREYLSYTRKKLFWIVSLAGPLLYVGLIAGIAVLSRGLSKNQKITILDGAGLGVELKKGLEGSGREITVAPPAEGTPDFAPLVDKRTDALIVLPAGLAENPALKPVVYSRKGGNLVLKELLGGALSDLLRQRRLAARGLPVAEIGEIFRLKIEIDSQEVDGSGRSQKSNVLKGLLVGIAMTMMVMMPALIWGQELMRSIVEEKNQRIIEILISSVTSHELLAGKILGIALVGLTQLALWIGLAGGAGAGVMAGLGKTGLGAGGGPLVTPGALVMLVIYFIQAFLMYALLYAIVGSAVNSEKEAQQFAAPLMIVMMLPWFMFGAIIQAPDAPYVVAFSLVPIYSPLLMALRTGLGVVPLWQGLLSAAMTTAMILLLIWLCAKIFRVGILMYGQKPSLAEVVKWIGRS